MQFSKWHGLGNDFVIVEPEKNPGFDFRGSAEHLCDRHFGIGADGVVTVRPLGGSAFEMRIYNSDGTETEMCGNATRCVGLYIRKNKLAAGSEFELHTRGGIVRPKVLDNGSVRVDMGEPHLLRGEIPVAGDPASGAENLALELPERQFSAVGVSVGKAHAVIPMARIKSKYLTLPGSYRFAEMNRKPDAYKAAHPEADIIRLGIGDVTRPLVPAVIDAMHRAVGEMGSAETFRGYGPEQGYDFLIEAIIANEYAPLGVEVAADEVFVSDGSKCDVGNIQEIFSSDARVAIGDPVYPVYLDSNVMAGRSGGFGPSGRFAGITYLTGTEESGFAPAFPREPVDLIYLCSPNNPTGTVLPREELARWVAYAKEHEAVILYDSAYSAYIREAGVVRSIYEIPGAREVAIEFKSFSKTAGFTGVRCAFTVVPKELKRRDDRGVPQSVNALWLRRPCTKFNGVSYIVQRGAEAVYTPDGMRQTREVIDYYMENAAIIRDGLEAAGYRVFGGKNAPYIWWKLPAGLDSMSFADKLLNTCQVVGTPGVGFGPGGEGYFRLTAFGDRNRTREAVERIRNANLG